MNRNPSRNRERSSGNRRLLVSASACALTALFLGMPACSGDDDDNNGTGTGTGTGTQDSSFECTTERDGWEQCVDNKVQYCHIVAGMDPHFHWGADCEALGFTCLELSQIEAVCVDESSRCNLGQFQCENNSAYVCVDHGGHGRWAIRPCGSAMQCHEGTADAHCEEISTEVCAGHGHLHGGDCHCDAGYGHDGSDTTTCVIDPASICTLFGGTPHPHAVVTSFADFPDAHAELYEPIEVELPANTATYIHFPVTHDDEYVVFVDTAGAIDAVMHRSESDVSGFHAAGANGMCAAEIPEHYEVELEMDGDAPPVPYIIRFSNQLTAATTVRFMVVDK